MESINWDLLLQEFETFMPDEEICRIDPSAFVSSLVHPAPKFVDAFIARKLKSEPHREEVVRALYAFLLQKRYTERLNLLHFAFNIFDETSLPDTIISLTPYPHEDGLPKFRHFGGADFDI